MIFAAVGLHQRLVKWNQLLKIRTLRLTFIPVFSNDLVVNLI